MRLVIGCQDIRAYGWKIFEALNLQVGEKLKETAKAIRRLIIKITTEAGSGHPSSCCSSAEIAAVLFCARSTVYRVVTTYRAGRRGDGGEEEPGTSPLAPRIWSPALTRSVLAILHAVPHACGWCRTRWSCATIALELQARRGLAVSAETVRRWLHQLDWVWKRAKLVAKDDDPQRVEKLNRTTRHWDTQAASCESSAGAVCAACSASTAAVTSGV
jgi:transposase